MRVSFFSYSFPALQELFAEQGLTLENASRLFNWHYKQRRDEACEHHNLARRTRDFVRDHLSFGVPSIVGVQESVDKTVKFLLSLEDQSRIECVLIPFQGKYTLCLSSQVGCGMNCSFCYTGKMGFTRHLRTEEIVGQLRVAQSWLTQHRPQDDRILNLVYMGQGEPLHNFEAVRESAKIFLSQHGLSMAGHRITVSTSGYLPGLLRWQEEMPEVNVALSLHSPFAEKRDQLIPINRRFPLDQVLPLVKAIPRGKKRFATYEYLLIRDFNDQDEDALETARILAGSQALVNLIPVNPFPGSPYQRPSGSRIAAFKQILDDQGIPTMVRTTKGDEILAACGQLNTGS